MKGGINILKINKRLAIISMVFISLLAIGAVSAADNISDDIAACDIDDSIMAVDNENEAISANIDESDVMTINDENEAVSANIDESDVMTINDENEVVGADVGANDNVLKESSGKGFSFGNGTGFNLGNMSFNINGTTFNFADLTNGTFSLGNGTSFNISSLLNGTFSFGNGSTFNISSLLSGSGNGTTFDISSFMNIFGKGSSEAIEAEDLTKVYTPTTTYKVTVKSGNKTVTQGNVVFTINNKEYIGHIGSDGTASISISGLKAGTYYIIVEYGQTMVKKTITIKKATAKLTAKNKAFKAKVKTKKYTITLKTDTGKALKKAKVTLKVKGKTYKATTNAKGKATFKITKLTKKGKHSATVKFASDGCYKTVSKTVKITVKK